MKSVKECVDKVICKFGEDNLHYRPPHELNEHKITCGVRTSVLSSLIPELEVLLNQREVKRQIVASGVGDWKYVDILSSEAGKLQVRIILRISNTMGFSNDLPDYRHWNLYAKNYHSQLSIPSPVEIAAMTF